MTHPIFETLDRIGLDGQGMLGKVTSTTWNLGRRTGRIPPQRLGAACCCRSHVLGETAGLRIALSTYWENPATILCKKFGSTFGFSKNKNLVPYVPKIGKYVILLSTMHSTTTIDQETAEQ
ncbi:hypothetical protein LAZ67_7000599 [Cordylochernes scorpioides]|uniref:Uncharacterized protein n=1 Tax=Cordylochernes scorpioides TaxID=51811 RepID=A0ABY6KRL3_9ARAC|nr:hypothetical protein LAZ67_7000599 [Cordylochernes scorpioides]